MGVVVGDWTGLEIGIEEVEEEGHEGHGEGEARCGFFGRGEKEAERVEDGAVEVVEEEDGDEGLGFRVVGVEAMGEEEEGEPERWAFH